MRILRVSGRRPFADAPPEPPRRLAPLTDRPPSDEHPCFEKHGRGPRGPDAYRPTETDGIQNGPGLFEREDWTLFRSLTTLPQKTGVPFQRLPQLACKELADNALDAAGACRVGLLDGENGFFVEDDGPGIPGTDDEVARLFSVCRPLASSKLIRLPTRGALGNGLRVVAGLVLASRGSLAVATQGRVLRLIPRDDGGTGHEVTGPAPAAGSRVEVRLGRRFVVDPDVLAIAERAIAMAEKGGPAYDGKTSPHWYDADGFWELCQAGGGRTVRELLAGSFDGCSEPAAGKIASVAGRGRLARELSRADAGAVLAAAKARAKPVSPKRLGCLGRETFDAAGYAKEVGEWTTASGVKAPVVVEAWSDPADADDDVYYEVSVNRTPVAAPVRAWVTKDGNSKTLTLYGCNARVGVKLGRAPVGVVVNVDSPFVPITTDGKTPDFGALGGLIGSAASKAAARSKWAAREPERPTQKALILDAIPGAAAKMSDGGAVRFSQRQLFYAVREEVKKRMPPGPDGKPFELSWDYFCAVVTDQEAEAGDIPLMTRDPRGTLYHPHTREEIPLGTVAVENYAPPRWTFNKLLYCEKEGFIEVMKSVGWPERHDCALVSSKGFASRAVRDVFDLLGEAEEKVTFFCVHDADAYGTMIYQTLLEATRARAARRVAVINLGLEPAEALEMGLEPEPVSADKAKPVAGYVEPSWREWLQSNRVELNAMTTRQFIEWLDAKLAPYAGKVIPPAGVMAEQLGAVVETTLRRDITGRVLAEAGLDGLVARAVAERAPLVEAAAASIVWDVTVALEENPQEPWGAPVGRIAERIALPDAGADRES
jgi:hypothetical protein